MIRADLPSTWWTSRALSAWPNPDPLAIVLKRPRYQHGWLIALLLVLILWYRALTRASATLAMWLWRLATRKLTSRTATQSWRTCCRTPLGATARRKMIVMTFSISLLYCCLGWCLSISIPARTRCRRPCARCALPPRSTSATLAPLRTRRLSQRPTSNHLLIHSLFVHSSV